ncbi:unnamed protein product [Sphenostylis stenocarpa]|uniref:cellulase n=1 Tax=Sphenostylis stenocarpa TaxID=92480 RepID=A0AA86RY21_9FABA|nr:unnamed protein product [Sphenostylis stenocarpa]
MESSSKRPNPRLNDDWGKRREIGQPKINSSSLLLSRIAIQRRCTSFLFPPKEMQESLTIHLSLAFTWQEYHEALEKSILFFEGQRSGKLPSNQRLTWRGDSGLSDGSSYHVDLVGGYYDAGDNVKFGLPMAFTTTLLAWSVIEFGSSMMDQIDNARAAIRWSTDYLLKAATTTPDTLYVQTLIEDYISRV